MSESRSVEESPSELKSDDMGITQIVGLTGIGVAALGIIVVIANQFAPRILSSGTGYLLTAAGLAGMFYHALRDGSIEVRRLFLYFSVALLFAALVAAAIPGPLFSGGGEKAAGYHFLPWTPLFAVLGLVFLSTALRHETNEQFLRYGLTLLVIVGAVLCVGSVAMGIVRPDTLVGPGILLGIVGIGFMVAYVSRVDTSDGTGHLIATLLGIVGVLALMYAIGKSIFPQLLYDGPPALKNAYQSFDTWKLLARAVEILGCLGFAAWVGTNKSIPVLLRAGLAIFGVGFALVFLWGSLMTTPIPQPKPYLVPSGLLLGSLGAIYLAISLGLVSDSQLITMTRRELGSYFHSPIAYFVLLGMTLVMFLGYMLFLGVLSRQVVRGGVIPEPILQHYLPVSFIGPIAAFILVPLLTMRTFSDEKRNNTLEVLLTAPVSEWAIVMSKFLACWLFYLLVWLPVGVYLIAFRIEGGEAFDYKPLLSAYGAIGITGLGFIAMGVFFSSLTKNQIIAAVMTFGGMVFLYLLQYADFFESSGSPFLKQAINALSAAAYPSTWEQALQGQLPVRDLILYITKAVFWLFLTIKILEARKWG